MSQQLSEFKTSPSSPLLRATCRSFLRLQGWQFIGEAPDVPKFLAVGAPHTSNWDFIYMMTGLIALNVPLSWLAKSSLFKPPLGWIMHPLGGIPVDRTASNNLVEQVVEHFNNSERLAIGILPEGTRSYTQYWKSGFYHIARLADIPIQLGAIDYKRKTFHIGPLLYVTGDVKADMDIIRDFFGGCSGRFVQNQGPIRLRMEEEAKNRAS